MNGQTALDLGPNQAASLPHAGATTESIVAADATRREIRDLTVHEGISELSAISR